jgi:predicted Zn-dependent protease
LKNLSSRFFVTAWLLLLAGCASVTTPALTTTPAPPGAQAGQTVVIAPLPKTAMSNNHAVIALLDQARTDNDSGRREAAGSSLERALRIEPRNPWLWLELAQLRLTQGQYAQAITLAGKANSFAGHDSRVQAANWQVIGQARVALGNSAGAEQAFKLSADLAQQAKADNNSDYNLK